MKVPIGYKIKTGDDYHLTIQENKIATMNQNFFLISSQGSGKSNLLQLFASQLFKVYIESDGKYGCIPIIFAPTFEYMKISLPSRALNLPPQTEAEGLPCLHITFPCCEPPVMEGLVPVTFDFNSLSIEDIGAFAGLAVNNKLGFIQKIIEMLKYGYDLDVEEEEEVELKGGGTKMRKVKRKVHIAPKPNYTVDDFIEQVQEGSHETKDALYYVFTKLREMKVFDVGNRFDIRKFILQKKPIVFHFGDLDDKNIISALSGLIMRELWEVGKDFFNASLKKQNGEKLSEYEEFLLIWWTVGLFLDEAYNIIYQTKSSGLAMDSKHPAHVWFKKITALMGRKRGFKYSFIITQKFMEIYFGVRTSFHSLILGNSIYPDDKEFLEMDLHINQDHINKLTSLPKYSWTMLDIDAYQKRKRGCAVKFKSYLSPCGQTSKDM